MKTIVATLVLALALLTGVLYHVLRTADHKTTDWQRVTELPTQIWNALTSIGRPVTNLFAATSEPAPVERVS